MAWGSDARAKALELTTRGNEFMERGHFEDAIQCFGRVLQEGPSQEVEGALLTSRARAYVGLQCFAQGLADAAAATAMMPENMAALYCKGLCEDELGMHRQSADTFAQVIESSVGAAEWKQKCSQGHRMAIQHLQEHEHGRYNWSELYRMDPGSLVSEAPIAQPGLVPTVNFHRFLEIGCLPGRGRGLVLNQDVPAGAIVLAEKVFAMDHADKLLITTATKLQTCSQMEYNRFFCLCSGHMPDNSEMPSSVDHLGASTPDLDPVIHKRKIDMIHVKNILDFNAHSRDGLDSGMPSSDMVGLWLLASLMNHSCCPNVQRTFVGDMMIMRAVKPLKVGSEVLTHYCTLGLCALHRRRHLLECYGFHCMCSRCKLECTLLPESKAQLFMERGAALCHGVWGTDTESLRKKASCLDLLADDIEKAVRNAINKHRKKLEQNQDLRAACDELWSSLPIDRDHRANEVASRLENMLCVSFLQFSMLATSTWESLPEPIRSIASCSRCCKQMEEVYTDSAILADWASRRVVLLCKEDAVLDCHGKGQGVSQDIIDASQYARSCYMRCYGEDVWELQVLRLGWPREIVAVAKVTSEDKCLVTSELILTQQISHCSISGAGNALVNSDERPAAEPLLGPFWKSSISEVDSWLIVSIAFPHGYDPGSVHLQVSTSCVRVMDASDSTRPDLVCLQLPRHVDESQAEPAKYSKRSRELVLKLPLI